MSDAEYKPKKRRKREIKVVPLNLAPLVDINANLLFFLIVANSVQEDRLQAGKDVDLPPSTSQTAEAGDLVSIVVSMNSISVNELKLMDLKDGLIDPSLLDSKKDDRIMPLFTRLTDRFRDLIQKGAQPGTEESKLPVVLIQADRRLPYTTVAKVMRTCGEAGFTKFRFAAKSQ